MAGRRRSEHADAPSVSDRAKVLEPEPGHAEAVIQAYYQRAVGAPDAARTRAQASFSITAAVAAVVLAALAGSLTPNAPMPVLALFCVCALAWLTAAGLFIPATSRSNTASVLRREGQTDEGRAGRLLAELELDRKSRDRWLSAANRVAGGAVILSLVTGGVLFTQERESWLPVDLVLSSSASAAVAVICGQPEPPLRWSAREDTLDRQVLILRRSRCGNRELRMSRDDASLVATDPQ